MSGWLQAAGVTLGGGSGGGEGSAGGGAGPPVIPDPQLVRRALAATLLHQPGAVPMFVASLRMYMDTLAKVGWRGCCCRCCWQGAGASAGGWGPAGAVVWRRLYLLYLLGLRFVCE